MFNQLKRKIQLLISRGIVHVVNDAYKTQNVQVSMLAGEIADDVERLQNYGLSSVPPIGSEALILSVGGIRQHLVAINVDNKSTRKKGLDAGDVALYHLDGHYLLLKKDGQAELVCKQLTVTADNILFNSPQSTFDGDVNILGNTTTQGNSITMGTSNAADHTSGDISGKEHCHYCPECKTLTSPPKAKD